MKNKFIVEAQLQKKGMPGTLSEEFIKTATAEDLTSVVFDMLHDFVSKIQYSLQEAKDMGMLHDYIVQLMEVEDEDGSKTTDFLLSNLGTQMISLPELVAAKKIELSQNKSELS